MFVLQKSKELVYVLLRVAVYIRRQELRGRIEKWSFELLENTAINEFEKALKTTKVLEELVKFGEVIYEIEPINAATLIKELSTLNSAIRQVAGLDELPNIESLFSKSPEKLLSTDKNGENDNNNGISAVIRQSAVFEKIRQSSSQGAQLKDLLSAFPSVSERTLRYDLQKLAAQDLINKVGNSGPGTFYVIK